MDGQMMAYPLTLIPLLERARQVFAHVELVSRRPNRSIVRATYADVHRRARALAEGLQRAGLRRGDRVATLMWNHSSHLEAYFGIPAAGGVLHTLNLRLHPDELAYIVNHAEDRFLIVDDTLLPLLEKIREKVNFERVWANSFSGTPLPQGVESYEALLAESKGDFQYLNLDENEAAAMCYTSGTTGKPKGVLYSHRAMVLHSFAMALPDACAMSFNDCVLQVSSMFHANGWGFPYTATMVGAKLVFPGPIVDGESLLDLICAEGVTLANGVPTVWVGVCDALDKHPGRWKVPAGLRVLSAGSAVPESLMRNLDPHGIRIFQGWGMTETTPLATMSHLDPEERKQAADAQYEIRARQGRPMPFVELRVMAQEREMPWDGRSLGELHVRGPWIATSYFHMPEAQDRWTEDGWFRTGDVVSIYPNGCIRIADRAKDLIKSGGEWISSVDLENALMSHPAVQEAAVVGVPHPKWQERPLAVVVCRDGAQASQEELREFLAAKFAKWQLPEAIVFATEIPRTSVGKFLKSRLREQYSNWKWEPSPLTPPSPTRSPVPGTQPEGIRDEREAGRFVREMFSRIAPRYDFLNHLLSFSLDRIWRKNTAKRFRHILARPDARVLDLCCGTGDLTLALWKEGKRNTEKGPHIVGSDFAHPMLCLARKKYSNAGPQQYIEADALLLPFPDGSFDLVTAAFGFRNLANYEAGLREIWRVLKPGGEAGILEFTEPQSALVRPIYHLYLRRIVPQVGGAISGSHAAYSYLPVSVSKFPSAEELAALMTKCGFAEAGFQHWTMGTVALHTGRRE